MRIFESTKSFPGEERYALTGQIRRSSRSVCANIAEAWHKGRSSAAFVNKLSDSEAEAGETQTWLRFAVECSCLPKDIGSELSAEYDEIISMLVGMLTRPQEWTL
jgi:four helix bundle protein